MSLYTLTVELVGSVSLAELNLDIQVRQVHISLAEINFHVHLGRHTYEPYLNFLHMSVHIYMSSSFFSVKLILGEGILVCTQSSGMW